eukprot:TRINITY_DN4275_c0_g1_i4.p2 TRINITY_DN4275_c0_g1~~TRINITY_DN4275_c0_g1_i4.p2  ORF type:complete len:241 (+),score=-9.26 TRINITY_DN4275_c0_g1_i4:425-1147(+)
MLIFQTTKHHDNLLKTNVRHPKQTLIYIISIVHQTKPKLTYTYYARKEQFQKTRYCTLTAQNAERNLVQIGQIKKSILIQHQYVTLSSFSFYCNSPLSMPFILISKMVNFMQFALLQFPSFQTGVNCTNQKISTNFKEGEFYAICTTTISIILKLVQIVQIKKSVLISKKVNFMQFAPLQFPSFQTTKLVQNSSINFLITVKFKNAKLVNRFWCFLIFIKSNKKQKGFYFWCIHPKNYQL